MICLALDGFGRLEALAPNAAIAIQKPAREMSFAKWPAVPAFDLDHAVVCARAAYPARKAFGRGLVIAVGSMLSIFAAAFAPAHGAAKGCVTHLANSLPVAWAQHGIAVNAMLTGWIGTDLTRSARREGPGLNEKVLVRTPIGRWGVPEDPGGLAVFLATREAGFVTGTAIPIDGSSSAAIADPPRQIAPFRNALPCRSATTSPAS